MYISNITYLETKMPEVSQHWPSNFTLSLLLHLYINKLPTCTSPSEVYFLKEQLHKMRISPNSLHQKEQKFQIYWVMQDFTINAGKVLP